MTVSAYRIVVEGEFDEVTKTAFEDMQVDPGDGVTVLDTAPLDQAALDGVLDRLRLIGALLVELHRVDQITPVRHA